MAAPPQQSTETEGELNRSSVGVEAAVSGRVGLTDAFLCRPWLSHEASVRKLIALKKDGEIDALERALRDDSSTDPVRRQYILQLIQSLQSLSEAERSAKGRPIDWASLELSDELVHGVKQCQPELDDEVLFANIARHTLYNVDLLSKPYTPARLRSRSIQFIHTTFDGRGDQRQQVLRLVLEPIPREVVSPRAVHIVPHPRMLTISTACAHKHVREGCEFDERERPWKTAVTWTIWGQASDNVPDNLAAESTSLRAAAACIVMLPLFARLKIRGPFA